MLLSNLCKFTNPNSDLSDLHLSTTAFHRIWDLEGSLKVISTISTAMPEEAETLRGYVTD